MNNTSMHVSMHARGDDRSWISPPRDKAPSGWLAIGAGFTVFPPNDPSEARLFLKSLELAAYELGRRIREAQAETGVGAEPTGVDPVFIQVRE
jgi:hypothetical protein